MECASSDEDSTGISIQNIGGVFILILGGIIISLTMLVIEFFIYKHQGAGVEVPKESIDLTASSIGSRSLDTDGSTSTMSINGLHRVNSLRDPTMY